MLSIYASDLVGYFFLILYQLWCGGCLCVIETCDNAQLGFPFRSLFLVLLFSNLLKKKKIRMRLKDDGEVRFHRTAFYCPHLKVNLSLFVLQMKMRSLREIKWLSQESQLFSYNASTRQGVRLSFCYQISLFSLILIISDYNNHILTQYMSHIVSIINYIT